MHGESSMWYPMRYKALADIRYAALIPTVMFTAFALLMVALRWCCRICCRSAKVGPEDYLVTAAVVKFGVDGAAIQRDDADPSSRSTMLKLALAQAISYHLARNLVKASLILQYMRLFSVISPVVWACYGLFVLTLGAAAWGVFGNIFFCDPVRSYWDVTLPGTCMVEEKRFWSSSVIGIVLDFAIWLLPAPVVGRLRLPKRQKMGLMVVFGLGGFVCAITLLRLILVYYTAHQGEVTKAGTYAIIFSSIEINLAISCASVLVMKPLFARFLPALISEQPLTAAEDARTCRALTGLHLLTIAVAEEEEEEKNTPDEERRDTLVESNTFSQRIAVPKAAKRAKKGWGASKRNTM
ncbi:hypothetical protein PTNB73_06466 [Pyrenophora teres f. teres]|uniref:Rhodopsin domain-containing protein n=1 Tax=Pyrenophora teres f. teres TaxID=97479 RepID=A0A6S6W920_9PLEO|nr:hypothetical protein HRS9139_07229 [Pyrenophora teres f. teres]KAE8829567.1 hypothetical protein HRS9122_09382 [Pyrenophora teres f. teres]KAE8857392.1 hypothetical protein PTNB29_08459 [Pyrenophora teres f. teres]KAE8863259.1 hypothetical protein PTNB73_06466 [Pyrenophora teres f. teres]CAE7186032.1 hypothetical protein PTTW11_06903 [Pyrenophora teres f. teres]